MTEDISKEILHFSGKRNPSARRVRLKLLQSAVITIFVIIILKLVQIQIIDSDYYRKIAKGQYEAKMPLNAARGIIYDRNNGVIASNSMYASFAADPQVASESARSIAIRFSSLFGKPVKDYLKKLNSVRRFVWLERHVDEGYIKKIDLESLEGVVIRREPKRLYFHDQVAGQLVGSTDYRYCGQAGIELRYDSLLRGTDGFVIFQRDGLGHARPTADYPRVEPVNGHNIYLTIDMRIQSIAERELEKGVTTNKADRGLVIIMNPQKGEILAIAQYPNIDPNRFGDFPPEERKLRAITDVYEPGSVFKIVTASAALENRVLTPDQKFYAENGQYTVQTPNGKPKTIKDSHPEGMLTFREAIEVSSNIVMAKVSELIGPEKFYRTARNYGFGIATEIDLPAEAEGVLNKPSAWSGISLKWLSFGYEVGVTPIQIAAAYAAVANDGILMKPYICAKETDANGRLLRETQPQQIRRVISPEVARTVKELFRGVVEKGTGKSAMIAGTSVAGKTGTSKKFVDGRYETGSYIASFVGFFPVESPQVLCLVMMDNPQGGNYYGGATSAPVFRAIAEKILNTSEIIYAQNTDTVCASGQARGLHKMVLPLSGGDKKQVIVFPPDVIPNVKGCSMKRAIGILNAGRFQPIVNGSGTVITQEPAAGQPARSGMKIILNCQPRTFATPAGN